MRAAHPPGGGPGGGRCDRGGGRWEWRGNWGLSQGGPRGRASSAPTQGGVCSLSWGEGPSTPGRCRIRIQMHHHTRTAEGAVLVTPLPHPHGEDTCSSLRRRQAQLPPTHPLCTHTYVHTHAHAHTYVHTHAHIHTHAHMHTTTKLFQADSATQWPTELWAVWPPRESGCCPTQGPGSGQCGRLPLFS